ncbi:MAG: T9SS type A sorting domain-containing protein [Balneolaceae bacterium]
MQQLPSPKTKKKSKLHGFVFAIFLLFFVADLSAQQLAFPGADGFGKYTTGGRGGDVYEVTNLNNSGSGSLREAVEAEGTRTIIFGVSGTIHLTSDLRITNNNISIFGQTAPGDGIAIKGGMTIIDADNVIIQYIRFRPGDISGEEPDALWGRENKDIIIDHVSMSWSVDETGSFYDNENFTLQWSILSESLYESAHDKGRHGYGGIWGGIGASFHHNLLAHHTSRNPRFNGARYTTTPDNELVDFRNNVIYNWGGNSAYGGERGNHNMVANYYKSGPATTDTQKKYRILDANPPSGGLEALGKWHIEDNFVDGYPEVTADNWDGGIQRIPESEYEGMRMIEPFEISSLEYDETAEEAYVRVLENAGAVLPRRDTVDARVVHETATGTATFGGVYGAGSGIIDSQEEVGGWPELLSATPPTDTDSDGIPDSWETENGLDPDDAEDGNEINETGYSNLESYIHTIQGSSGEFLPVPGSLAIISPKGESDVSVRPEFSWNSASYATDYELEIRDGAGDYGEIILATTTEGTTFSYPENEELEGEETYFWRVRGVNEEGEGPWTAYEYFITEMVTSNEPENGIPVKFTLEQNYPNPFNPTTNIRYGLPQTSNVDIRIFDMTGREVARKSIDNQQAGFHTIEFNLSSMSSGVYIYKFRSIAMGNESSVFTQTRKMTLIK